MLGLLGALWGRGEMGRVGWDRREGEGEVRLVFWTPVLCFDSFGMGGRSSGYGNEGFGVSWRVFLISATLG